MPLQHEPAQPHRMGLTVQVSRAAEGLDVIAAESAQGSPHGPAVQVHAPQRRRQRHQHPPRQRRLQPLQHPTGGLVTAAAQAACAEQ
jgi:hypothetical protein